MLYDYGFKKRGEKTHRTIVFEPRPKADVDVQAFPMKMACEAVQNDPLVSFALMPEEQMLANSGFVAGQIEIMARKKKRIGNSLINFSAGVSESSVFLLGENGCVLLEESKSG
jgi:hypothetical protein